MDNCSREMAVRGFCRSHYNWLLRRGMFPDVKKVAKHGSLGIDAKDKSEYQKEYRKLRGFKSIGDMHKVRFGGLRERVIRRDGEACVDCGLTREEHKEEFNCDITVNHIDHTGRTDHKVMQNDTMDNLETLCLRCHGSKDAIKHGKYATYAKSLALRITRK